MLSFDRRDRAYSRDRSEDPHRGFPTRPHVDVRPAGRNAAFRRPIRGLVSVDRPGGQTRRLPRIRRCLPDECLRRHGRTLPGLRPGRRASRGGQIRPSDDGIAAELEEAVRRGSPCPRPRPARKRRPPLRLRRGGRPVFRHGGRRRGIAERATRRRPARPGGRGEDPRGRRPRRGRGEPGRGDPPRPQTGQHPPDEQIARCRAEGGRLRHRQGSRLGRNAHGHDRRDGHSGIYVAGASRLARVRMRRTHGCLGVGGHPLLLRHGPAAVRPQSPSAIGLESPPDSARPRSFGHAPRIERGHLQRAGEGSRRPLLDRRRVRRRSRPLPRRSTGAGAPPAVADARLAAGAAGAEIARGRRAGGDLHDDRPRRSRLAGSKSDRRFGTDPGAKAGCADGRIEEGETGYAGGADRPAGVAYPLGRQLRDDRFGYRAGILRDRVGVHRGLQTRDPNARSIVRIAHGIVRYRLVVQQSRR